MEKIAYIDKKLFDKKTMRQACSLAIKDMRLEAGLTQKELGKMLNKSSQEIAKLESFYYNDRRDNTSLEKLLNIALMTNKSANEMLAMVINRYHFMEAYNVGGKNE